MRNNFPVIYVYKKRTKKSGIVTQLLYGETFKKLNKTRNWIKIKNDIDNYKGYIINKKFSSNHKDTHKICVLSSNLYSKPNSGHKINKKLSFGSKIKVLKKKNNFCKFNNHWIKIKDLKKVNTRTKNPFNNIKNLLTLSTNGEANILVG